MNILNEVVKGASRQFGREFGRAGANAILKGKNYYTVRNYSDFSGRIKPSDSEIVRAVKEMNKINFVSTNKANTSRLIELTDLASNQIIFEGLNTLNQLSDITKLIDDYNDKFEHGSVLIDDDFKDKSIDYLKEKREDFVNLLEKFNADTKAYIKRSYENALRKRKSKKVAALLCFPFLGFQWVYLKDYLIAVISFLCCWTIIVPVLNIIHLFMILFMSQDKFDKKYNPEFYFYSQFNITEDEIVDEISDTKYDINGRDELFYEAAKLVVKKGSGSASDLQLNFKIGYHRSGKIINQLEEANILQHSIGGKIKKALIKNSNDLDILIKNEK
tara:strand:- start:127 stop:1119 length:993 start_codon:yes stop_codon:yes gene_type:complete